MTKTVQFYYQLENFYQNHRLYLKSVVLAQLIGSDLSASDLTNCDNAKYVREIGI